MPTVPRGPRGPPHRPAAGTRARRVRPGLPRRRSSAPPSGAPGAPGARVPARAGSSSLLLLWVVYLVAVPLFAWTRSTRSPSSPTASRPDGQPGTTYLLVGSDSRAGLTASRSASSSAPATPSGQRTDTIMLLHTGSGPEPADVDPPRLDRRHPRPRHHQDQRRLRVRRPEAAGEDHRAEHRHPDRRLRRDRLRRLRRRRRRGRRHPDLPEAGDEGQARQPRHQEGLPAGRRQRPRSATPARGTPRASATSPAPQHQREVVSAVGTKAVSPWTVLNPVRYWRLDMAGAGLLRLRQGHRHRSGPRCGRRR